MERDLTEALALLLSREDYRRRFASDPHMLVRELGLKEEYREAFLALRPTELERQARVLIQKRRYETRRRDQRA